MQQYIYIHTRCSTLSISIQVSSYFQARRPLKNYQTLFTSPPPTVRNTSIERTTLKQLDSQPPCCIPPVSLLFIFATLSWTRVPFVQTWSSFHTFPSRDRMSSPSLNSQGIVCSYSIQVDVFTLCWFRFVRVSEFHATTRRFIIARKNWFLGPFPSGFGC